MDLENMEMLNRPFEFSVRGLQILREPGDLRAIGRNGIVKSPAGCFKVVEEAKSVDA